MMVVPLFPTVVVDADAEPSERFGAVRHCYGRRPDYHAGGRTAKKLQSDW